MITATIALVLSIGVLLCAWLGIQEFHSMQQAILELMPVDKKSRSIFSLRIALLSPMAGAFVLLFGQSKPAIIQFRANMANSALNVLVSKNKLTPAEAAHVFSKIYSQLIKS